MINEEIKGINLEEEFKKDQNGIIVNNETEEQVTKDEIEEFFSIDKTSELPDVFNQDCHLDFAYGNDGKTQLEKMAENASLSIDDELTLGQKYDGQIKKVFHTDDYFRKLFVVYEVDDNGAKKTVSDEYPFGGEYDQWYMDQLMMYIKRIDGLSIKDIDFKTTKTIADSLQFLVGADVTLYQYLTKNDTRKNRVTVHGRFDRTNQKIVNGDVEVC